MGVGAAAGGSLLAIVIVLLIVIIGMYALRVTLAGLFLTSCARWVIHNGPEAAPGLAKEAVDANIIARGMSSLVATEQNLRSAEPFVRYGPARESFSYRGYANQQ